MFDGHNYQTYKTPGYRHRWDIVIIHKEYIYNWLWNTSRTNWAIKIHDHAILSKTKSLKNPAAATVSSSSEKNTDVFPTTKQNNEIFILPEILLDKLHDFFMTWAIFSKSHVFSRPDRVNLVEFTFFYTNIKKKTGTLYASIAYENTDDWIFCKNSLTVCVKTLKWLRRPVLAILPNWATLPWFKALKQGVFNARRSQATRLQCKKVSNKESSVYGALMQGVFSARRS